MTMTMSMTMSGVFSTLASSSSSCSTTSRMSSSVSRKAASTMSAPTRIRSRGRIGSRSRSERTSTMITGIRSSSVAVATTTRHYFRSTTTSFSTSSSSALSPPESKPQHTCHSTSDNDDNYRWPSLYDEARDMMMASYILYPLSFLIREAKIGNLKDSQRVLQTLQTIRDGDLDTVLCPRDIKRIVMDNRDYISRHPQNNLRDEYGWYTVLKVWQDIDEQQQQQLESHTDRHTDTNLTKGGLKLLEFDDHNDSHRLVYGIAVNEVRKRLTVIFRGTYADGTDDWKRNLEFDQIELPLPYNLRRSQEQKSHAGNINSHSEGQLQQQDDDELLPESIRVHQGMYNYLFNNVERDTTKYQKERYEEILSQIQECIDRYPGFKIYVTGHSAGGALAELFTFYLATSRLQQFRDNNITNIPKPVTCVSFGSLCLGDIGFQRAYQRAEQLGWIRHVRVLSQGDPICYMPPLANYMPAGMHLQLHRGSGFSLWRPDRPGNNTWSSLIQMLRFSITQRSDLFNEHSIPSYLRRLEREQEALSLVRLNDLYRNANYIPAEESLSLY